MKIIIDRPPNYEAILAVFPLASNPGVVFAYGDRMYNPSGVEMPPSLIDHEKAHGKRQLEIGVEAWWDKYLTDPQFRYDEEVIAHKAEYHSLKREHAGKGQNKRILDFVVGKLIAPLYGFPVGPTKASKDIRGY